MDVPVLTLAITASTNTSGFPSFKIRQSRSTITPINPLSTAVWISSPFLHNTPVIFSTSACPSRTALENATVLRTVVGSSISVIAT